MKIRTTNSICTSQDFADAPMSPTTGKVTHTHCVNVKTILVSLYNIPEIEKHLFHVNAEPCVRPQTCSVGLTGGCVIAKGACQYQFFICSCSCSLTLIGNVSIHL